MQEGEVKKRNRRKKDHHKVMHGLELPQMLSLFSSIGGRQEQASSTTPLCQLRALGCDLSGESQSHPYGSTNLEFYPQKFEPLIGVHDPQLSSPKMTFVYTLHYQKTDIHTLHYQKTGLQPRLRRSIDTGFATGAPKPRPLVPLRLPH